MPKPLGHAPSRSGQDSNLHALSRAPLPTECLHHSATAPKYATEAGGLEPHASFETHTVFETGSSPRRFVFLEMGPEGIEPPTN
jgi:hypothetical protein